MKYDYCIVEISNYSVVFNYLLGISIEYRPHPWDFMIIVVELLFGRVPCGDCRCRFNCNLCRESVKSTIIVVILQLYFFTVEFGLCKQEGQMRVYGAGLLSSVAELKYALNSPEKIKRFDPDVTCRQTCIITAYQDAYWYTDSFEEAKDKMRWLTLMFTKKCKVK